MKDRATFISRLLSQELVCVAARWILGPIFVYMGLSKALDQSHVALNLIAATLPWFEMLCGLLLLGGIAVRGSAVLLIGMLVPFTTSVLNRAMAIQAASAIPFCAIRFDCGCGAGEVIICHKLLENAFLILLSTWLLLGRDHGWCLRRDLITPR